jgi:hypothetical protein
VPRYTFHGKMALQGRVDGEGSVPATARRGSVGGDAAGRSAAGRSSHCGRFYWPRALPPVSFAGVVPLGVGSGRGRPVLR